MVEVNLDFSAADSAAFQSAMDRLSAECGWAIPRVCQYGFIKLLTSVRASTKKSPKVRNVRVKSQKHGDKRRVFQAQSYKGGKEHWFDIFAYSLAAAKNSPAAQIRYSGLAKASWGLAMRAMFNSGSNPRTKFGIKPELLYTHVEKGQGHFSATVTNRVNYVEKAFITEGKRTIDTAMARATRQMIGKINSELKKAGAS